MGKNSIGRASLEKLNMMTTGWGTKHMTESFYCHSKKVLVIRHIKTVSTKSSMSWTVYSEYDILKPPTTNKQYFKYITLSDCFGSLKFIQYVEVYLGKQPLIAVNLHNNC